MRLEDMTAPQFAFFSAIEYFPPKDVKLMRGTCRMCGGSLFRMEPSVLDFFGNIKQEKKDMLIGPSIHHAVYSENWTNEDIALNKNSAFDCPACNWVYMMSDRRHNSLGYPWKEVLVKKVYSKSGELEDVPISNNVLFTVKGMAMLTVDQMRNVLCNPPEPPFMVVVARASKKFALQYVLWRASVAYSRDKYPVLFCHGLFGSQVMETVWVDPLSFGLAVSSNQKELLEAKYKSAVCRLAVVLRHKKQKEEEN